MKPKLSFRPAISVLGGAALTLVLSASAQINDPLAVVCPEEMTVITCNPKPVAVEFPAPTVSGYCSSNLTIAFLPPSGSELPLGTNLIQCTVMDPCGNTISCQFNVVVIHDTTPPSITCLASNHIVHTGNPAGDYVYFDPPIVFDNDPNLSWWCEPPFGSFFPMGSNVVNCFVTDLCGNTNSCSFIVEVRKAKINGDLVPGGLNVTWNGDGWECADNPLGPWEPGGNSGPGQQLFRFNGPSKFIRPGPGPDNGIPPAGGEIAYVETGLHDQTNTPAVKLLRQVADHSTAGGSLILAANHGGGLNANAWSDAVNIPFKFYFYGVPRTKLCVSKNGLVTFSTDMANEEIVQFEGEARKLPNPYFPPETIACFQSEFIPLDATNHVRAYLYGDAPLRQVWIVWHGHPRKSHGRTHTALVLEETHNRLLMVDMKSEFPLADEPPTETDEENDESDPDPGGTIVVAPPTRDSLVAVGVQKDMTNFLQVTASPRVQMVNESSSAQDNDFFVFKPYQIGRHIAGKGANALNFIDAAAVACLKTNNLPGITVAVTYKGRLVYNKAFGFADVEKNLSMKPHHRAHIGSVSKVLTAAGIFKAVELGLIPSVDTFISHPNILGKSWITNAILQGIADGVHTSDPFAVFGAVQIKHLLSHTSAFRGSGDSEEAADLYNNGDYATSGYTNVIKWFYSTQSFLTNGPGKISSYSNHGYGELGQILEHVSGLDYETFLRTHVFNPIGLNRVRLGRTTLAQQDPQHDSRRYHHYSKGAPHAINRYTGELGPITYDYSDFKIGSAGSWTATAADLARFMCATDRLPNHSDILSTNSLALMESDPVPDVGSALHGWMKSGSRLWHNGSVGIGSSFMEKNSNSVNIAVVANTAYASELGDLVADIRAALTGTVLSNISQFYDLFSEQLQLAP